MLLRPEPRRRAPPRCQMRERDVLTFASADLAFDKTLGFELLPVDENSTGLSGGGDKGAEARPQKRPRGGAGASDALEAAAELQRANERLRGEVRDAKAAAERLRRELAEARAAATLQQQAAEGAAAEAATVEGWVRW